MSNLRDKYCIVGIGETPVGKVDGITNLGFNLLAAKLAIEDAGLTNKDIDGVLTTHPYGDPPFMYSIQIAEKLGIQPTYTTDLNLGGATPVALVEHAVMGIEAGLASTVVVSFGEALRSKIKHHGKFRMGREDFGNPYGEVVGITYAMAARRHMHQYGTTNEQFGHIAVAMRKHACLNPNAQEREPITIADYHASPWICEPFRRLDICLISNGGGAVVVTSAERARNMKKKPVYISAFAEQHTHKNFYNMPDMTTWGAKRAAEKLYKNAGVGPKDVDVAEFYDCFTYTVLVQIEDYGFCPKGEGGRFVENGNIELGGELPVNTHGGLLSQAHIDGMLHITEGVKQLRGECGPRQVKDAEVCLVTGNGGSAGATHSSLMLRR
ncbi:MAG: thiolase family protein [Candidatus Tectomicrobia bacterium]|nr:thiolase family protein [Candidatus Tectomicrobia bacterium]